MGILPRIWGKMPMEWASCPNGIFSTKCFKVKWQLYWRQSTVPINCGNNFSCKRATVHMGMLYLHKDILLADIIG